MLAAVEQDLADEPFVVVGVHSPKFPTEADAAMVLQAVRRHGVTHPVVVDAGHRIWDEFGVRAWPTLVVVGPDGVVVGAAGGEPDREPLLAALRQVLDAQRDLLRPGPLPLRPEAAPPGSLAFPGGIAVGDDEVYVADTGHHQIVVCDPRGREVRRYGSGAPGLVDGTDLARFSHPHGLAVAGGTLVVADTGNHAVREVDLATGAVTTIAGTGARGRDLAGGTAARATALRSPWDVVVHPPGGVRVGMAGSPPLGGGGGGGAGGVARAGRAAPGARGHPPAAFPPPTRLGRRRRALRRRQRDLGHPARSPRARSSPWPAATRCSTSATPTAQATTSGCSTGRHRRRRSGRSVVVIADTLATRSRPSTRRAVRCARCSATARRSTPPSRRWKIGRRCPATSAARRGLPQASPSRCSTGRSSSSTRAATGRRRRPIHGHRRVWLTSSRGPPTDAGQMPPRERTSSIAP